MLTFRPELPAHFSTGADNSDAESLWSTFKHECYYRHTFATIAEIVAAVDKWMNCLNTQRRHSTIGMLSPSPTNNHSTRSLKPHNPCPLFWGNLSGFPDAGGRSLVLDVDRRSGVPVHRLIRLVRLARCSLKSYE
ncbi:integrase core domain-containing protein [Mycolicibacterium peregrinum]|uniref:integrase core domain-containing protein n=1 Tax=Mycolicibacterium peregrinum TaxID=43304 RepID=UPI0013F4F05B